MKNKFIILMALCSAFALQHSALAQGTGFTYQGRLDTVGAPAAGTYDIAFTLYDSSTGGTQLGNALTNAATPITNGLFAVTLDFGNQFPGADRWLDIRVRTNGGGAFFTLTPRQKISPAPYAVTAGNLTGTVAASQLTGSIVDARLSSNVALRSGGNAFTGNQTVTGGAVGIGTSSPTETLTVAGTGRFTSGLHVGSGGSGTAFNLDDIPGAKWILDTSGFQLSFMNDNGGSFLSKMAIDSSGSVSVFGNLYATAVNASGSGLTSLNGSSISSGTVADTRLSSNVALRSGGNTFSGNQTIAAGSIYMDNTQAIYAKNSSGAPEVFLWPRFADNVTYLDYGSGGLNIRNNVGVPTMFMKNDGRVGIGTINPSANLQVVDSGAVVGVFVGNRSPFGSSAFETDFTTSTTHAWFAENGTNVFNVGPGGTGYFANSVTVGGSTYIGSGNQQVGLNGNYPNVTMTIRERGGDDFGFVVKDSGGNDFMNLQSSGNRGLYLTGTPYDTVSIFWTTFSDERLKQDVRPYEAGLKELLQLQTVRYRYLDDAKRGLNSKQGHSGVIAQQAQKIFPDAVLEGADGYLSLQADSIFWASIHAIQELNHKMDEKDAKISELEKRLSQLEKGVQTLSASK